VSTINNEVLHLTFSVSFSL